MHEWIKLFWNVVYCWWSIRSIMIFFVVSFMLVWLNILVFSLSACNWTFLKSMKSSNMISYSLCHNQSHCHFISSVSCPLNVPAISVYRDWTMSLPPPICLPSLYNEAIKSTMTSICLSALHTQYCGLDHTWTMKQMDHGINEQRHLH